MNDWTPIGNTPIGDQEVVTCSFVTTGQLHIDPTVMVVQCEPLTHADVRGCNVMPVTWPGGELYWYGWFDDEQIESLPSGYYLLPRAGSSDAE